MERNCTSGSVFKNIIIFALPYFFSILLQTLYGIADLFITGQFNGTACITAVSIGSQIMHMLTLAITGLAMGATITIGKAIGSGQKDKAALAIGNSTTVFLSGSFILMLILIFSTQGIIHLMSTPLQAVEGAQDYLKICFLGIPFITAYNLISAIFRGLGDSKTPMYLIIVAFICNICLDYLFIGGLGMQAAGAALGTTLAQAVSVICAMVVILGRKDGISITKNDFKIQLPTIKGIFKIGIPVFLQNSFIQISFLAVTVFVNMRGLYDAAAVGIVEKMIGIMFLVPSSMHATVSALAAQNLGAEKKERAVQTLWYSVGICICFGILTSIITVVHAPELVRLFEDNVNVVRAGTQYIKGYVWDCIFAGMHFCFSGYFCALEKSELSFLHNFFSIILIRIPGAYLAATIFLDTLFPLGLVTTSASLFSVIFCMSAYFILEKRQKR